MYEPTPIEEFPNYGATPDGHIYNLDRGTRLTPQANQDGVMSVALYSSNVPYRRAVSRMIATMFVRNEYNPSIFDTPIHLDGNLKNAHVDNLMWRPRWFAVKYHAQFKEPSRELPYPIHLVETDELFMSFRDAAMTYGLLEIDIQKELTNRMGVFPTGFHFRRLEGDM